MSKCNHENYDDYFEKCEDCGEKADIGTYREYTFEGFPNNEYRIYNADDELVGGTTKNEDAKKLIDKLIKQGASHESDLI